MNKKKTKNILKNKIGGEISNNEILEKIISIGFEFETGRMIPFIVDNNILYPFGYRKEIHTIKNRGTMKVDLTEDQPLESTKTSLLSRFEKNVSDSSANCKLFYPIRSGIPNLSFNSSNNDIRMGHTEFHFTYTEIKSTNIIIECLKKSVKFLREYLNENILTHCPLLEGPSQRRTSIRQNVSIYKCPDNIVYLLPNDKNSINGHETKYTLETIHFYIHMTIGVELYNAINVLYYLLNDSQYNHKELFEECVRKSFDIVNEFIVDNNNKNINNKINIDNQNNIFLLNKLYNWITLLLYFVIKYKETRNKTQLMFILRHTYSEIYPLKNIILHKCWIEFLNKNSAQIIAFITPDCYTFMFTSSNNSYNLYTPNNSKKFNYDGNIILIEYRGLNLDFKRITGNKKILLSDIDKL